MVNMLHLPSIRSSRESPGMPNGMEPDIVEVRTYMCGNLVLPWRERLTVEQVCIKAAKLCGIPRLTSNLFALYDKTNKKWLCPKAQVFSRRQRKSEQLEYRVRFHTATMCPSGDSQGFMLLEENVVNYMFCQYRESFLNDEFMGLSTEESLGLMVLDFMQHVKEDGTSLTNLNGRLRFGRFLPKSLNEGLSWWDKRKLRRKVRTALTDFRDDPRETFAFRVMFLVSLSEEMKQKWGTEQFTMANGDIYEVSGVKGVTKKKLTYGDEDVQDSFPFQDIIDITIYPSTAERAHTLLQINRRSTPPMILEMECRDDAESFACLLDGYYRLLVDYYHYLSETIAPPSLVRLVKNRCHGPIPLSKAKQKIEETGRQEGVYLIRQNPEDHYSYCLTVRIHANQELKNFKINCYEDDDQVGLDNQRRFNCLRSFVEFYRSRENSWCLEGQLRKGVPIEPKDPALRILDRSALNVDLPSQPETGPIRWIQENNLSSRTNWRHLGDGDFTEVWAADLRKKVGNRPRKMRVAIKCPKMDAPQSVQQKFSQSVDLMSSWVHKHIIRFEGIGAGYMLVMEYASEGPLDHYLRSLLENERKRLGLNSQLHAAFQLIDALEYLESRRIVHGNVSAHNTLVLRPAPNMHIKLADPMLGVYYHSLEMTSQPKLERVRWTAPELLATNSEPTLAGDKFSYAITLWQIMSHGAIPAENLSDEVVRDNYRHGVRLDAPPGCPQELLKIMEACWSHNPRNRPSCRGVLRDVNSFLTSCSGKPEFVDPPEVEMIPTESDDEDDHTDLDNVDNERRDTVSPPNGSGLGEGGGSGPGGSGEGATGGASILVEIESVLNPTEEDDILDPDEETKFIGVNRIPDGQLKKEERLGSGHFGMVFRGVLMPRQGIPAEIVAVKVIKNDSRSDQFQQEIRAMSYCDHKNIVKVLGYCEDNSNRLSLVMEYFPLGSLEKYLREKKDRVSHKTLYLFGQQICQGMKYLHEERMMVHRDLAARNVLVSNENEVKITDFGLARIFGTEKDYYRAKESSQKVPIKWYAPEWLRHQKYQKESDVWSLGIVLWEMFSYGQDPIYQDSKGRRVEHIELLDFFEKGMRLTHPPSCPAAIEIMMNDCWEMDPLKRPKFHSMIVRLGILVQNSERGEMGSSSSSYGL